MTRATLFSIEPDSPRPLSWWAGCIRLIHWLYFKPFTLVEHIRTAETLAGPRPSFETYGEAMIHAVLTYRPNLYQFVRQLPWQATLVAALLLGLAAFVATQVYASQADRLVLGAGLGSLVLLNVMTAFMVDDVISDSGWHSTGAAVVNLGVRVSLLSVFAGLLIGFGAGVPIEVFSRASLAGLPLALVTGLVIGSVLLLRGVLLDNCLGWIVFLAGAIAATATSIGVGGMTGLLVMLASAGLVFFRPHHYGVEWLWVQGWVLLTRVWPALAAVSLRWSPPHWHDVIWFPLPGLLQLIVRLSERDRAQALAEARFLSTTLSQKGVSQQALVAITVRALQRGQTLPELIAAIKGINWLPERRDGLPADVAILMPELLSIADRLAMLPPVTTSDHQPLLAGVIADLDRIAGVVQRFRRESRRRWAPVIEHWSRVVQMETQRR